MSSNTSLSFRASGKLLITGEYAVLDGATALALPTRLGQTLEIRPLEQTGCVWKSYDSQGILWFEAEFSKDGKIVACPTNYQSTADTLVRILTTAQKLNPDFNPFDGFQIKTHLEFPNNWGLGSSSTLLYNLSQWAQVDAYQLLSRSFGGSGYDVAVPAYNSPILYTLHQQQPQVQPHSLPWSFKEQLYFVHLNQKQNSKEGIAHYQKVKAVGQVPLKRISELTIEIANAVSLDTCLPLFEEHEQILSTLLQLPTIKEQYFPNYPGMIKSLGAWGGDFILISGDKASQDYFKNKGYSTLLTYTEMIA